MMWCEKKGGLKRGGERPIYNLFCLCYYASIRSNVVAHQGRRKKDKGVEGSMNNERTQGGGGRGGWEIKGFLDTPRKKLDLVVTWSAVTEGGGKGGGKKKGIKT